MVAEPTPDPVTAAPVEPIPDDSSSSAPADPVGQMDPDDMGPDRLYVPALRIYASLAPVRFSGAGSRCRTSRGEWASTPSRRACPPVRARRCSRARRPRRHPGRCHRWPRCRSARASTSPTSRAGAATSSCPRCSSTRRSRSPRDLRDRRHPPARARHVRRPGDLRRHGAPLPRQRRRHRPPRLSGRFPDPPPGALTLRPPSASAPSCTSPRSKSPPSLSPRRSTLAKTWPATPRIPRIVHVTSVPPWADGTSAKVTWFVALKGLRKARSTSTCCGSSS